MDLDSLSYFVYLLCLFGAGLCSDEKTCLCPCPQPPPILLTETPSTEKCCEIGSFLRYSCQNNYVRKAGTSSLSKCKQQGGIFSWSTPTLICIPDPKITTTPPPWTTVTNSNIGNATISTSGSYWRMPNQNISTSPAAEIQGTETTTHSLRVPSDRTQGKQLCWLPVETTSCTALKQRSIPPSNQSVVSLGDPVTDSRLSSWTFTSSPAMLMPANNDSTALHSYSSLGPSLSAIGVLAIVCTLIGLGVFYYKWRAKRRIPEATEQELRPMNDEETGSPRLEC